MENNENNAFSNFRVFYVDEKDVNAGDKKLKARVSFAKRIINTRRYHCYDNVFASARSGRIGPINKMHVLSKTMKKMKIQIRITNVNTKIHK